jgi:hypothetical protein
MRAGLEFRHWKGENAVQKQLKYAGLIVILGLAAASYAMAQVESRGARHVRADLNGY